MRFFIIMPLFSIKSQSNVHVCNITSTKSNFLMHIVTKMQRENLRRIHIYHYTMLFLDIVPQPKTI